MNQVRVLCFAIVVLAVCHVEANPMKRQDAADYQNYVNCIDDMQNNCEKSGAQFEVLIQGPSGSRFVRSLVLADADAHKEPIDPTHVSTISVFQPNGHKKLVKRDIEADVAEALADSANADAATIDERTAGADMTPAADPSADKKDEPKVGSIAGLLPLQLGALNLGVLKQHIGLRKAVRFAPLGVAQRIGVENIFNPGLNPITNPVLNPIVNPAIIPARLAAFRAKVGLGLLPLATPII